MKRNIGIVRTVLIEVSLIEGFNMKTSMIKVQMSGINKYKGGLFFCILGMPFCENTTLFSTNAYKSYVICSKETIIKADKI
jgi:hypothetical protein